MTENVSIRPLELTIDGRVVAETVVNHVLAQRRRPPMAADEPVPSDESTTEMGSDRSDDPVLERRRAVAEQLDGAMENRRFEVSAIELREVSDGGLRFTGYASTTERSYEVGDFTETIARGAFKRTLSESPDTVLLINHEGLPLARTKAGTMTLTEDARGLRVDADLDGERRDVQDLARAMARRDIDQMSFAFRVTDQSWNQDYTERLIRSVTIHRGDVSVVTMGANDDTSSSIVARSADGLLEVRAGRVLSGANQAELQAVLDRIARADEELDAAQPQLAAVMGVANPDSDDEAGEDDRPMMPMRRHLPDWTTRARQEFDLMIAREQR